MDFEDDNTVAPLETWIGTQLPGIASLTQEIVTVNCSKALKINQVPEGLITIYSTIAKVNMDPTYLYMYGLTITVKQGVPVLFRYVEDGYGRDFFVIKGDGTLNPEALNPRFSFTKTDNGDGTVTYDVLAFSTPTRANVAGSGIFEIATNAAGTGTFDVTLDNLIIAKTDYPILQLDFETENEKVQFGQGIGVDATSVEYASGDSSLRGQNSLHYTGAGNLIVVKSGTAHIGMTFVSGVKYKISFKVKVNQIDPGTWMPVARVGLSNIGYVKQDSNGELYFEAPTEAHQAGKVVIDEQNKIYELSMVWTADDALTEFDFAIWGGNVDMIVDDITIEVVR